MTQLRNAAVLLGVLLIGYAGCGRSALDDPYFGTTDVSQGAAGTGGRDSASMSPPTGGAGRGAAGTGVNTGAGANTGAAGGSAGRTGAAAAGGAGASGSAGTSGRAGSGGITAGAAGAGAAGTGVFTGAAGTGVTTPTGAAGSGGPGLACGDKMCAGGQSCCVQAVNGMRVTSCLDPGQQCVGGGNIGCVAGSCSSGLICCLSLVGMASACSTPAQCMDGVSTVLCSSNADCPGDRQYCCPAIGVNICRPYRCPRAGGGGNN
jgi:hypothetical protein